MDSHQPQNSPPATEGFGIIPNAAAPFGKVPQDAESFGTVRNTAEGFRNLPNSAEDRDKYTLSVREVARLFETAGVARSERSIVNWCQRNALGAGKLDAYFDPNERKYFITLESVDLAIAEERAKASKRGPEAEIFGTIPPKAAAPQPEAATDRPADAGTLKTLEAELLDLKIVNKGKDFYIEQLQRERTSFAEERKDFVAQLVSSSRRLGELETKLLQLAAPDAERQKKLEARWDSASADSR